MDTRLIAGTLLVLLAGAAARAARISLRLRRRPRRGAWTGKRSGRSAARSAIRGALSCTVPRDHQRASLGVLGARRGREQSARGRGSSPPVVRHMERRWSSRARSESTTL